MYTPNCDVFWVGSYPFKDPVAASRRILSNPNILPHWPQLPRRSKKEAMVDQTYAASGAGSGFPKGSASGWNAMWRLLRKKRRRPKHNYFKTQLAGPVTLFGKLDARGRNGKSTLFHEVNLWLEHAYWQIDYIQEQGFKPIVVLDEPMLPAYMGPAGSAKARRVQKLVQSIVARLKRRGALVGVHCCNRVSPVVLIDLGVDLIHFDAYYFPSQIVAAREKLQRFLQSGGIVAWGIVPAGDRLSEANQAKLERDFFDLLAAMEARGLPLRRVVAQSMVSPTCGTGALSIEQSDHIVAFASSISRRLKSRFGL